MRTGLWMWLLVLLHCTPLAAAPQAARIERFTPLGTAKGVRQVTAVFATQMVPFGDPRLTEPFTVDCPEPGRARWVDAHTFAYEFERDLPGGVGCSFTLRPNLKDLAGNAITGETRFRFDTGGPAVSRSHPYDGSEGIDEKQVFVLRLDAAADPTSLEEKAHCQVKGVEERIPLRVLAGEERSEVLQSLAGSDSWSFRALFPGEGSLPEPAGADDPTLVLVQCRRALPPETEVRLALEAGLKSASGIASTEPQVLGFKTRPAFLARFECERVNRQAGCLPLRPMRLVFTSPVPLESALKIRLEGPEGQTHAAQRPENAIDGTAVEEISFPAPLPESLTWKIVLPDDFRDDGGRALENGARFPLEVRTDELPPLARFPADFGILESKEGGVLPVSLRRVEDPVSGQQQAPGASQSIDGGVLRLVQNDADIIDWIKRVKAHAEPVGEWDDPTQTHTQDSKEGEKPEPVWKEYTGSASIFDRTFDQLMQEHHGWGGELPPVPPSANQIRSLSVPKPNGADAFEVVGIPLKEPGFYVVELASPRLGRALLGEERPRYVATSALVTNLAVHFKWGREASLVWVTALDSGQPVPDAEIQIRDYCSKDVLWNGKTGPDGTVKLGAGLPKPHGGDYCGWGDPPLFVSARKDGELGFTLSSWNRGITPGDFRLPEGNASEAEVFHTVFDRPLLRAGETVSMKHYLRHRRMQGFGLPDGAPDQLTITHSGSGQKTTLPVRFDALGIAESSYEIPADARLGEYDVSFQYGERTYPSGGFRVEEFRLPTMRALVQAPKEPQINPRQVPLDLYVGYLSGGPAGGLPVKLRTQVQPRGIGFRDFEQYDFGGEPVQEGSVPSTPDEGAEAIGKAGVIPLSLDAEGALRTDSGRLPPLQRPATLLTELEYPDPNGEILTATTRIPLWTSKVQVGIATDGWVAQKDQLRVRAVAVDTTGKPVKGQKIEIGAFRRSTYSYRKRLIGGFYAYEDSTQITKLDAGCSGRSDDKGLVTCELKPDVAGEVIVQATTQDEAGNASHASREVWLTSSETPEDWWFSAPPSDRIDVLPEQPEYQPGETLRLQVRMPFREATALVTVEREGVIDHFVTTLSGKEPVVEVPMHGHYAPNVYVSVLALRGRIQPGGFWDRLRDKLGIQAEPTDLTTLVDLARPAWKLGIAQVRVGHRAHRLDVRVTPEAEVYKVRDKARVKVQVARADGQAGLPEPAEVAIAAVDQALLELKSNDSWKLLEAMMGRRGIEVYTATAQMQVTGKRHYGRKAVPTGGGGGRQEARELFDTLLLWKGRVPLDAKGEAELEIPLNDSLTSFRIAAVASAGADRFGTGEASIRSTQDLMLLSGLPPLVREQDRYSAGFTVRNAGQEPLEAMVEARVTAQPAGTTLPALAPQTVELKPGEARQVTWELTAPLDAQSLAWDISASAGAAGDHLKVSQQVIPVHPVRVYQATLEQLEPSLVVTAERPTDAIPGRGGVSVTLRRSLVEGLDGVREYMGRYPFTCLEQRLSQAVALGDEAWWNRIVERLGPYQDRSGLLKYFPSDLLEGSDILTSYVLAVGDEAGWSIPENSRNRALDGLTRFVDGQITPYSTVSAADLAVRKLAAIEALSRHDRARAEMLDSITPTPNLWPTSALLDWMQILHRLQNLPQREQHLAEARNILLSRLNLQGSALNFSTEASDHLWWLMVSTDVNAARSVLAALQLPELRRDVPRLVRGTLLRQRRGHWDLTTANAWGTLAMGKFGEAFEQTPVTGQTRADYAGRIQEADWTPTLNQQLLTFPWAEGPADLLIEHQGSGKPWAVIQSSAALPLKEPLFTGFQIQRSIEPVEQKQKDRWTRGDVVRIRLQLESDADMTWVVVDDPIPAGSTILGSGLGRDSAILSGASEDARCEYRLKNYCLVFLTGQHDRWLRPAFVERKFDSYKAYYEYVPKGQWTVEYTVRLNNPGQFEMPATRVEAMYLPEMFGELPVGGVGVGE